LFEKSIIAFPFSSTATPEAVGTNTSGTLTTALTVGSEPDESPPVFEGCWASGFLTSPLRPPLELPPPDESEPNKPQPVINRMDNSPNITVVAMFLYLFFTRRLPPSTITAMVCHTTFSHITQNLSSVFTEY
jgi:hypothetical protein